MPIKSKNKEILIFLLNNFADWEVAYLASAINVGVDFQPKATLYTTKFVSIDGNIAHSIGGMKIIPDYGLDDINDNYEALILIGGFDWFSPDAEKVIPLIENTLNKQKILAGICNASLFLAIHGFINDVKHTSNLLDIILQHNHSKLYKGQNNYLLQPVVRDKNIITANGCASLAFTQEILCALNLDTTENIQRYYDFHQLGFYEALKKYQ